MALHGVGVKLILVLKCDVVEVGFLASFNVLIQSGLDVIFWKMWFGICMQCLDLLIWFQVVDVIGCGIVVNNVIDPKDNWHSKNIYHKLSQFV